MSKLAKFLTFKQPYFRLDKETNQGRVELYENLINAKEMQILGIYKRMIPERYVDQLPYGTLLNYSVITYKFKKSDEEHTVEHYDLLENTIKWLESVEVL